MRALLAGLLAATLVTGCTTVPHPERGVVRAPAASKVSVKYGKSAKVYRARAVSGAKSARSKTATRGKADPVTEKAKSAIAAMLDDPASAKFHNLKRAQKKLLNRERDTVCGYVQRKANSGEKSKQMPFLYTVDDGEAYLVNGKSHVAETVHRALCK